MNNVNVGVDAGNFATKLDNLIVYKSTLKRGHIRMNNDDIQITYNGIDYTIGSDDGVLNLGLNKYEKEHYKLMILTGIAMRCNQNKKILNVNLVVGVPITQYNNKQLVKHIENIIMGWGTQELILNGVKKTININNVTVFCESGIVFKDSSKYKGKKVLVVDLGGSTVDKSLWDNFRLIKFDSDKKGTLTLKDNISRALTDSENVIFKDLDLKSLIETKTLRINGIDKDVSNILDVEIKNYIDDISSNLYQNFDLELVDKIAFIGGGSELIEDQLHQEFTNCSVLENASFVNAQTYKVIGDQVYGNKKINKL